MTDNIEKGYIESEYEEIFNDWFEIEGVKKVKEHSRQLRTFFNYKTAVIRYRYRSSPVIAENYINNKFFAQQQKIKSLSVEFLNILNKIKQSYKSLGQGICSSIFTDKATLNKLTEVTRKLSTLLHYFSEESIHIHPKFLKYNISIAQTICLVKKFLYTRFSEFYEELKINYHSLEEELDNLLENTRKLECEFPKKQSEEGLTS